MTLPEPLYEITAYQFLEIIRELGLIEGDIYNRKDDLFKNINREVLVQQFKKQYQGFTISESTSNNIDSLVNSTEEEKKTHINH